jgi:hypothetical protein
MKRCRFFFFFLLFLSVACRSKEKQGESENNIDAARNFIRAALDGKFNDARNYMLGDTINTNYLDIFERSYHNFDQPTRDGYRSSTIRIIKVNHVTDSVTTVIYANSYKNDPDTLKVLKINGRWLVDLKYLYQHDLDTSLPKPVLKDSIP